MTAVAAVGEPPARTYGNWRRPSTPGLPRLGMLGTAAALGALVVVMLVQVVAGLAAAAAALAVAGVLVAPLAWRDRDGRTGWQALLARAAWAAGRARGQDLYLAARVAAPARRRAAGQQAAVSLAFGSARLPGLLAGSALLESVDAAGDRFAVVLVPAPAGRQYTVLLRCDPDGAALVDPETAEEWVAQWGAWLARLAHQPGLVAVSVTVQTSPDPGERLAAEARVLLVETAPPLARAVLTEAAAAYAVGAAATSTWVALTFTGRTGVGPGRGRREAAVVEQLGRRLPGLLAGLSATGAGACRPMAAGEVTALVRAAYDPAAGPLLHRAVATGEDPQLGWGDAGPTAQAEAPDHLRHDGAASVTWMMTEPPRGAVHAGVLEPLLAPDPLLAAKRVTVTYRPHDAATAVRVADTDVRTALGQATLRRGESRAEETAALAAARQTAAEQAAGAGLLRFSLLVTATVAAATDLPLAAEVVEALGPACQLRLRRVRHGQSAAFAAALGVGVVLTSHVRVPESLREAL